jgi:acyl-CoA reductase-like NAD-dependent aldehyde dehydrogenase
MYEFSMTIGGEAAPAQAWFDVFDPATDEVCGRAPDCTVEQLDEAMRRARQAFPGWAADPDVRSEVLRRSAEIVEGAIEELAPILVHEQGKPLADAQLEIRGAAARLRFASQLRAEVEVLQDDEQARVLLTRKPLGVIAAISPWNAPLIISMAKVGPALAAGNTVVLKPSPFTPLSTLRLGELLREVFPPGVFSVVSGKDGALGEWMTSHPIPAMADFTGSVRTGKLVAAAAAPTLKRVALELGGNDPAIMLDDADPGDLSERVFWGAFANCGQVCIAIKRLYVPRERYSDWVDALSDVAGSVKVGPGMEEGVKLGPLNNAPQADHVERLVDDALRNGAEAAAGGHRMDRPGNFFEPTIVAGASDGQAIVDDEQFGPALPVIPYDELEDAVRAANDTHFGLGASVWGEDADRAASVASRLESGTAWVNTHRVLAAHIPFEGAKESGYGGNAGTEGFHEFTQTQVLYTQR